MISELGTLLHGGGEVLDKSSEHAVNVGPVNRTLYDGASSRRQSLVLEGLNCQLLI